MGTGDKGRANMTGDVTRDKRMSDKGTRDKGTGNKGTGMGTGKDQGMGWGQERGQGTAEKGRREERRGEPLSPAVPMPGGPTGTSLVAPRGHRWWHQGDIAGGTEGTSPVVPAPSAAQPRDCP